MADPPTAPAPEGARSGAAAGARLLRVSARNQWFQRVDALRRNRRKRHRERRFFVEGVRSIDQLAARPEWRVEAFLYARGRDPSSWAREILRRKPARFHLELCEELMGELSDRQETSELLAIVEMPDDDPGRIPLPSDALGVLVDRPASPGNLGTLVRSCDALGAHGLVVSGRAADLYDPLAIRAAAGSLFALPALRLPSGPALDDWLARARRMRPGLRLIGSSAAAPPAWGADLRGPLLLLVGNERRGLSRELRGRCDALVGLPMRGSASSLNAATAGTAILAEILRQRG